MLLSGGLGKFQILLFLHPIIKYAYVLGLGSQHFQIFTHHDLSKHMFWVL